eukprot:5872426-Pleurochrysis_carterae.AAC.1
MRGERIRWSTMPPVDACARCERECSALERLRKRNDWMLEQSQFRQTCILGDGWSPRSRHFVTKLGFGALPVRDRHRVPRPPQLAPQRSGSAARARAKATVPPTPRTPPQDPRAARAIARSPWCRETARTRPVLNSPLMTMLMMMVVVVVPQLWGV